jgi:hypothetical protein
MPIVMKVLASNTHSRNVVFTSEPVYSITQVRPMTVTSDWMMNDRVWIRKAFHRSFLDTYRPRRPTTPSNAKSRSDYACAYSTFPPPNWIGEICAESIDRRAGAQSGASPSAHPGGPPHAGGLASLVRPLAGEERRGATGTHGNGSASRSAVAMCRLGWPARLLLNVLFGGTLALGPSTTDECANRSGSAARAEAGAGGPPGRGRSAVDTAQTAVRASSGVHVCRAGMRTSVIRCVYAAPRGQHLALSGGRRASAYG